MNQLSIGLSNTTTTENGAVTNASTLNPLLDFFGLGAALRTRSEIDIVNLFAKAFAQDKLLALKTLFYIRDVRGGQGERRSFRFILKWLAQNHPEQVILNLNNIANYGRFDDLLTLLDTNLKLVVLSYIQEKLVQDTIAERPSLLAKWLPSINTSSKQSVVQAYIIAKHLGLSPRTYRKTLSALRQKIDVVEQKMCSNKWNKINYSRVPSRASMIYRKAFRKHDEDGYGKYLEAVEKGEAKINASTLYPYDIVAKAKLTCAGAPDIKSLDLQWNALPNYLKDNPHNGIVVADVSGSMNGTPIDISIGLAIYFAERNIGPFKDKFITFSKNPQFHTITGNGIVERVTTINKTGWDMNTNLQATFELILSTGIRYKVPQEDMPEVIYIVSDMEFDAATGNQTNLEAIKAQYAASNYKMPKLVFWNVDARNNQSPIRQDDAGTCLVSGASPSILKNLLLGKNITPMSVFLDTINSPRYEAVRAQ